jgi:hypothetical protein
MVKGPKRYVLADPILPSSAEALAARRDAALETVLAEEDGLGIFMLRIPPHGSMTAPDPATGAGQSMIVAAGSIVLEGKTLDRLAALFVSADEKALDITAGSAGGEVLVLQYPRQTH